MLDWGDNLEEQRQESIFDNLPEFLSPDQVCKVLPFTTKTIYDWRYRPAKYKTPEDLFVPFGRKILIRRDVLKKWVNSRNAS